MTLERPKRVFEFGESPKKKAEPKPETESSSITCGICGAVFKYTPIPSAYVFACDECNESGRAKDKFQWKINQKTKQVAAEQVTPPRTTLKFSPDIIPTAKIKILFLWENLPDTYRTLLDQSASEGTQYGRGMAGQQVLMKMKDDGYDMRRTMRRTMRMNQESLRNSEVFELTLRGKTIARLIFDDQGRWRAVKV